MGDGRWWWMVVGGGTVYNNPLLHTKQKLLY